MTIRESRFRLWLGLALAAACLPLAAQAASLAPVLVVAPHGRGRACTAHRPCSLQTAQMRARALAPGMQADIQVLLRGGTYRLTGPLAFGPQDSGRNGFDIIWRGAAGKPAVLDGAIRIRHWHRVDRKENLWSTAVPAGVDSLQLYVNGRRAVRARGLGCQSPQQCHYTPTGLTGVSPRLATFRYPRELVAVFSARWRDFHCPVASITGTTVTMAEPCWHNTVVDSKNGWRYASPAGKSFKGIGWFENAYELLGTPGQFYLDTHTRRIYYVPRPGENMKRADVELPVAQSLLTLTGTPSRPVHNLQFENISFADTTWLTPDTDTGYVSLQAGYLVTGKRSRLPDNGEGMTRIQTAVTVLGGDHITFSKDGFFALGAAGIALAGGTRNSVVAHSRFSDLSGGAVFVGDTVAHPADPREKSSNNVVARNLITNISLQYRDNVGIMGGFNNGLTIDHNTIEDVPYTGISVGWGWNYEGSGDTQRNIIITHNLIRNFMLNLYDGGAIYTQAQSPGSEVCANYIDFSGTHHANGIYLDERSRGYQVHRNVVWNIHEHPNGDRWLSAWASWSGDLVMTNNWTDDAHLKPHNPGPTKVFGPNFPALKTLPAAALRVVRNAGADAPDIDASNPCGS